MIIIGFISSFFFPNIFKKIDDCPISKKITNSSYPNLLCSWEVILETPFKFGYFGKKIIYDIKKEHDEDTIYRNKLQITRSKHRLAEIENEKRKIIKKLKYLENLEL